VEDLFSAHFVPLSVNVNAKAKGTKEREHRSTSIQIAEIGEIRSSLNSLQSQTFDSAPFEVGLEIVN
jgi:hypothetical protein